MGVRATFCRSWQRGLRRAFCLCRQNNQTIGRETPVEPSDNFGTFLIELTGLKDAPHERPCVRGCGAERLRTARALTFKGKHQTVSDWTIVRTNSTLRRYLDGASNQVLETVAYAHPETPAANLYEMARSIEHNITTRPIDLLKNQTLPT